MNNAKREHNDKAVLHCLDLSKGRRFNDIKRGIGKGSDATSHSIKRLMGDGFVLKKGKRYSLSLEGAQLAKGDREDFPRYTRKKQTTKDRQKIGNAVSQAWERRKAEGLKNQITFLILWMAGNGVAFETVRSENREFRTRPIKITPSTVMAEMPLNQIISLTPYTKVNGVLLDTAKGVSLDDYFSEQAVSLIPYCHLSEFEFKRPQIEKCIRELERQGILKLKEVYNLGLHKNEKRYQIMIPILQDLIEDLSTLVGCQLERKRIEWQRRDLSKDEISWLEFILPNPTRINNLTYYREIRKAIEGKHPDKDLEKTILILRENDRDPLEQIKSLGIKINEIRKNISEKYYDVKDEYPYNLMLRHSYP